MAVGSEVISFDGQTIELPEHFKKGLEECLDLLRRGKGWMNR